MHFATVQAADMKGIGLNSSSLQPCCWRRVRQHGALRGDVQGAGPRWRAADDADRAAPGAKSTAEVDQGEPTAGPTEYFRGFTSRPPPLRLSAALARDGGIIDRIEQGWTHRD